MPVVVVQNDWDGVVSAKYLLPDDSINVLTEVEYLEELASGRTRVSGETWAYFEIYDPRYAYEGDIIVSHHRHSRGDLDFIEHDTGYLLIPPACIHISRNPGRDYSNVAAVKSLVNTPTSNPLVGRILREAVEPPEDVVHYSDIIEYPDLADSEEEINTVIGYIYESRRNLLPELTRMKLSEILGILSGLKTRGRRLRFRIPELDVPKDKPLVVIEKDWTGPALTVIAFHMGYRVVLLRKVGVKWRVMAVSRDKWAAELASKLGGTGRRTPRGYIGVAIASDVEYITRGGYTVLARELDPHE